MDDQRLKEHNSHWEAGAKQNFDTGLYTASTVLYIRVKDYGPKPKIGKHLVMDKGHLAAADLQYPELRGRSGYLPHHHGEDETMSRVTYDAGTMTITVDGLEDVERALGT